MSRTNAQQPSGGHTLSYIDHQIDDRSENFQVVLLAFNSSIRCSSYYHKRANNFKAFKNRHGNSWVREWNSLVVCTLYFAGYSNRFLADAELAASLAWMFQNVPLHCNHFSGDGWNSGFSSTQMYLSIVPPKWQARGEVGLLLWKLMIPGRMFQVTREPSRDLSRAWISKNVSWLCFNDTDW